MDATLTAAFSARYSYAEWPAICAVIPKVCAGVYAVWQDDRLIYCGMSGRQLEKNGHKSRFGLVTRLQSHWSGRLSGDQFCVYVANRLVIPDLTPDKLERFRDGSLRLDQLTQRHIQDHFEFQHVVVKSSREAHDLEGACRSGMVFGVKPLLNPA